MIDIDVALETLKDELSMSDLPFQVDVLDWHAISPSFQKVIEQAFEVVQKPSSGADLG